VRARELLELERSTLRMFTSCAWFFDDVTGIETRLVLRIAAHAIALAGTEELRIEFLARLKGGDDSGAPALALVPDGDAAYVDATTRGVAGFAAVRGVTPQLRVSRVGWFDVACTDAGDVVGATNRRTGRVDYLAASTRHVGGEPRVTVRLVTAGPLAGDVEEPVLGADNLPEREAAFLRLAREIGVPTVRAPRRAGEPGRS